MSKTYWIAVKTNKREYWIKPFAKIMWLPGEKVISMEVVEVA